MKRGGPIGLESAGCAMHDKSTMGGFDFSVAAGEGSASVLCGGGATNGTMGRGGWGG